MFKQQIIDNHKYPFKGVKEIKKLPPGIEEFEVDGIFIAKELIQ